MKHNPDNRKDNVDRIQRAIDNTIRNVEITHGIIPKTDDDKTRKDLTEKNDRRIQALDGFRAEIKDEADDRENGYK